MEFTRVLVPAGLLVLTIAGLTYVYWRLADSAKSPEPPPPVLIPLDHFASTFSARYLTTVSLYGMRLQKLDETIGQLLHLTHLDLDLNQLPNLPRSLANLSSLAYISYNGNSLTSLPAEFDTLTCIENCPFPLEGKVMSHRKLAAASLSFFEEFTRRYLPTIPLLSLLAIQALVSRGSLDFLSIVPQDLLWKIRNLRFCTMCHLLQDQESLNAIVLPGALFNRRVLLEYQVCVACLQATLNARVLYTGSLFLPRPRRRRRVDLIESEFAPE